MLYRWTTAYCDAHPILGTQVVRTCEPSSVLFPFILDFLYSSLYYTNTTPWVLSNAPRAPQSSYDWFGQIKSPNSKFRNKVVHVTARLNKTIPYLRWITPQSDKGLDSNPASLFLQNTHIPLKQGPLCARASFDYTPRSDFYNFQQRMSLLGANNKRRGAYGYVIMVMQWESHLRCTNWHSQAK